MPTFRVQYDAGCGAVYYEPARPPYGAVNASILAHIFDMPAPAPARPVPSYDLMSNLCGLHMSEGDCPLCNGETV